MGQTDMWADVSQLDVLCTGMQHLPLKQLQLPWHCLGNGKRTLQKDRSLPCTGDAQAPRGEQGTQAQG